MSMFVVKSDVIQINNLGYGSIYLGWSSIIILYTYMYAKIKIKTKSCMLKTIDVLFI